jgi:hypothetical protein
MKIQNNEFEEAQLALEIKEEDLKAQLVPIQKEIEELKRKVNVNKASILGFERHSTSTAKIKTISVLTPNPVTPARAQKSRALKWMKPAIKILLRENKFMDPEVVYHMVLKENPEYVQTLAKTNTPISTAAHHFINNMKRGAELFGKRKKNTGIKSNNICMFKDKIGLENWMTDDKVPEPKYIKEFMYLLGQD